MKKWVKVLLIVVAIVLVLAAILGITLHFTSAKYKFSHDTPVRAYVYHNELGREIYEFSEDELARLKAAIEKVELGDNAISKYTPSDGGPTFSFFLQYSDDRVVQIYAAGNLLHINSVPFEINDEVYSEISALHLEIEDKILPLSPELIQEIIDKSKISYSSTEDS